MVTDDQFTTVPFSCRHIYALVCNNFEFDGASKGSAYTSFFLRTRLYMQLGQHELSSMKMCITKQCQDRFQFSLQEGCRKNQYMSCSTLTRKQHSYGLPGLRIHTPRSKSYEYLQSRNSYSNSFLK